MSSLSRSSRRDHLKSEGTGLPGRTVDCVPSTGRLWGEHDFLGVGEGVSSVSSPQPVYGILRVWIRPVSWCVTETLSPSIMICPTIQVVSETPEDQRSFLHKVRVPGESLLTHPQFSDIHTLRQRVVKPRKCSFFSVLSVLTFTQSFMCQ